MAGTHRIEIELLQNLHVFTDDGLLHHVSPLWMLHVTVLGIHFHRHAIQVEHPVFYLGFLKTYALHSFIDFLAFCICERQIQCIEIRRFGSPFQGMTDQLLHTHCPIPY